MHKKCQNKIALKTHIFISLALAYTVCYKLLNDLEQYIQNIVTKFNAVLSILLFYINE